MRDFEVMRSVLAVCNSKDSSVEYGDFRKIQNENQMKYELKRLSCDGLIKSNISFLDEYGTCLGGEAEITPEGREFYRLIESVPRMSGDDPMRNS